jgi:hypothetical protein
MLVCCSSMQAKSDAERLQIETKATESLKKEEQRAQLLVHNAQVSKQFSVGIYNYTARLLHNYYFIT